jgi:hypothetical protein
MGKRAAGALSSRMVQEAARIVVEDGLSDYRLAKQKAAERLGLRSGAAPMPSNADLQAAVIQYQRLFGGSAYASRLVLMRRTAVQAMRMLKEFSPRLVGAVASGATTEGHDVQLHCFADKPEMIDVLLESKGLAFTVSERRYRYGDGQVQDVPVLSFDAADIGVSVAVFPERDQRRAPLSSIDGAPVRRLDFASAEALAEESPDTLG